MGFDPGYMFWVQIFMYLKEIYFRTYTNTE